MDLWTVDVWVVKPGSEDDFLALLREHSVGGTGIFLDDDRPRTYWVPRQWESRDQLDDWHRSFAEKVEVLVEESTTHVMQSVS